MESIQHTFPPLVLRGRSLLPIIQGGMGVGISAHGLAGAVAREGAVGTIASVDLRRLHPDLMQRTRKCRDPAQLAATNVEALDREIRAARAIAGPTGFIAVTLRTFSPTPCTSTSTASTFFRLRRVSASRFRTGPSPAHSRSDVSPFTNANCPYNW